MHKLRYLSRGHRNTAQFNYLLHWDNAEVQPAIAPICDDQLIALQLRHHLAVAAVAIERVLVRRFIHHLLLERVYADILSWRNHKFSAG